MYIALSYSFPNSEPVSSSMSGSVASWQQVRWSGTAISLRIFQFVAVHTVKGFSVVNEADVFLEFPCLPQDPMNVGNLISSSSMFSKSSLTIWNFSVHVLLKPSW